jgi:glutamyl-Q tRNA(Asp) synthetase
MRMYRGRFAPSPTGPLHAGSLVAALASWLDARAHGGVWLVRMEDVDAPRCKRAWGEQQLAELAAFGLVSDEPVVWQSERSSVYAAALSQLKSAGLAYPCTCTRSQIEARVLALHGTLPPRNAELVYPGTCRPAPGAALSLQADAAHAFRLNISMVLSVSSDNHAINSIVNWNDRRLGAQSQNLVTDCGDFVLKRADGMWAYQLAVVVDDAAQGISHVVRGEDLLGVTARQIRLQQGLALPTPQYFHTPLVLGANGEKLSKQNGAQALQLNEPRTTLGEALRVLGLQSAGTTLPDMLHTAVQQWRSGATQFSTKN